MSMHVVKSPCVRNYVKTHRKIKSIFANVSKHVVHLTLCLPMRRKTSLDLHLFRKYVKTRHAIYLIFASVSKRVVKLTLLFVSMYKHVVKLTLFLQMSQIALYNSHLFRRYVKTHRTIDIMFANA